MEFDSLHICLHILVRAGQSVLYQCTQCVYVCAHMNIVVHMCIYVMSLHVSTQSMRI